MYIYKCNKCQKAVKKSHRDGHVSVVAMGAGLDRIDFCERCSPGYLRFLKKYAKTKERDDKKH